MVRYNNFYEYARVELGFGFSDDHKMILTGPGDLTTLSN